MNRLLFLCTLGACALPVFAPFKASAATGRVSLSISDARLVEPPSGQKSIIFPIKMSGVVGEDVHFSFATSLGPNATTADSSILAQPGFDFSSREGQLTIPAGSTQAQIEVPVLADTEIEKDETFTVTIGQITSSDNNGNPITASRAVAKGTIVEPVKGLVLGGKVVTYDVAPYRTFDPLTGLSVDRFDAPAQATAQRGVVVTISGQNIARTVATDARGNFSLLVLPGSYSVQVNDFSLQDYNGNPQTYSMPARTIALSRDSRSNVFSFYGVAGTVGVPSFGNSKQIFSAYVQVEARPVGADPSSAPVATAIANYYDSAKVSRGSRFFIPALPKGSYTLSFKDVADNSFYSLFYNFPTVTFSVPTTTGVNRPDAHVEVVGTTKPFTSQSTRKSSSAHGS